jgi:hypothetical protein
MKDTTRSVPRVRAAPRSRPGTGFSLVALLLLGGLVAWPLVLVLLRAALGHRDQPGALSELLEPFVSEQAAGSFLCVLPQRYGALQCLMATVGKREPMRPQVASRRPVHPSSLNHQVKVATHGGSIRPDLLSNVARPHARVLQQHDEQVHLRHAHAEGPELVVIDRGQDASQ